MVESELREELAAIRETLGALETEFKNRNVGLEDSQRRSRRELRNSPHRGNANLAGIARMALEGAKGDETGYRIEFLELVSRARQLRGE